MACSLGQRKATRILGADAVANNRHRSVFGGAGWIRFILCWAVGCVGLVTCVSLILACQILTSRFIYIDSNLNHFPLTLCCRGCACARMHTDLCEAVATPLDRVGQLREHRMNVRIPVVWL